MSIVIACLLGISAPSQCALLPVSTSAHARIDVEFQDADIHFVLRTLGELGRVNIVAESGIKGRVTARLRHTTWREALEQILASQHLEAEYDGNMIFVRPIR